MVSHPATFGPGVLSAIRRSLDPDTRMVLDPFAGVGGIHDLGRRPDDTMYRTYGVEIEPEWANAHWRNLCRDARSLPEDWTDLFDAIATSPAYGNRMADSYDGRDGSRRHTYRMSLDRPLTEGNGAGLQWGQAYRDLHCAVYHECWRVLRPGGLFVLNMKDHIRAGRRQFVTAWHVSALREIGFVYLGRERVLCPGMRHGANHALRIGYEVVARLRKLDGA